MGRGIDCQHPESDYSLLAREFGEEAAEFFAGPLEETSGYYKQASGMIVQWGETNRGGSVSFPICFGSMPALTVLSLDGSPVRLVSVESVGFKTDTDRIKYTAIGY